MNKVKQILSFITGGKNDVYNAVVHYRLNAGAIEIIEAFEIETEQEKGFIHTICHTETGGRGHSFGNENHVHEVYLQWRKANKVHQCTTINEILRAAYK